MRIVLLGDGRWAALTLKRLLDDGHEVPLVVLRRSPSEPDLSTLASDAGIPTASPGSINNQETVERLSDLESDLLFSISYDQILRRQVRETAPHGAMNAHAGKLPYYRGRSVLNWVLINGEQEIGLTVHQMDDGIDTGDIIQQTTLPVPWEDTYGSLLKRVEEAFPPLISRTISQLENGIETRQPQAHLRGTYFAARREGDEWLDWTWPSTRIYNKIRAITRPGPGARTTLDGETMIVWSATYDPTWPKYIAKPGEVVARTANGVTVKTGDSTIDLSEVQFSGDDESVAPDLRIGTRFQDQISAGS